ncbi:unknown [Bacteroides sp. CAG:754]|nr:unknown [Bacteroides sp. CAG:754]
MTGIITAAPRPIMYLNTSSILFYFFSVLNDKLLCFPQRVLVVNRAKSTTFSAFFQDESINLSDIASKMDIFDVCVHKISRFRARKTKNAPT